ncbi:MAG: hypothetical protein AAGA54_19820 [Myxococcota bacterium]
MLDLFVVCAPGVERLLAQELTGLGLEGLKSETGGVSVRASAKAVGTVALWSGLANHLRLRVGEPFEVRHFDKLVRKTAALPWRDLLKPGTRVEVAAVCRKSRLYHSDAVAQRVTAGIEKAIGPAHENGPTLGVAVRILRDQCILSLDLAGDALHRRGWRQQTAKAPLREDLARALLIASGWTPARPLFDPMMGAGTLVIEAATMARNIPPGIHRRFAFEDTKLDAATKLASQREAARAGILERAPCPLLGRDRADGALQASVGNAARAGVQGDVDLALADLSEPWPALQRPIVVTNPPYGVRVGSVSNAHDTYGLLGRQVKERDWPLGVVVADRRFLRSLDAAVQPALKTDHGGIKVEFFASPSDQA